MLAFVKTNSKRMFSQSEWESVKLCVGPLYSSIVLNKSGN